MLATWMADALRAGGCAVDETRVPDWKARGHDQFTTIDWVVGHHTAGPATGDYPSLAVVRDGRSDLPGPLANLGLTRSGVWVPIAAGVAWHAGTGSWPGIPTDDANYHALGVEAESTGVVDDWTPAQRTAYPQGVAALLRHMGQPAAHFIGHKEWAPTRKIDPAFWDMNAFRADVAGYLTSAPAPAPAPVPPAPPAHPATFAWNLPAGHYYGNIAGPAASHGGYYASERDEVKIIQQWLVYHGCTPIARDRWATSTWSDGRWEGPTDVAMGIWHDRFYPHQPYQTRCYADDLARLFRP